MTGRQARTPERPLSDYVGMYADFEVYPVKMYTVKVVDADLRSGKLKVKGSKEMALGSMGTPSVYAWVYPAALRNVRPPGERYTGVPIEPLPSFTDEKDIYAEPPLFPDDLSDEEVEDDDDE